MCNIADRIKHVRERMASAEAAAQRPPQSVKLLGVSKTRGASDIRLAFQHGVSAFGENYVQEAQLKLPELDDLRSQIEWHFIGPLQSNKARFVAEHFDWMETIDRLKIAQKLNAFRPDSLPPLNVCIQVNIDDEASKSGVRLNDVIPFSKELATLPQLRLRGLMSIPKAQNTAEQQQDSFQKLYECLQKLSELHPDCDTLSLGMSADLESAIAAGSTQVRIGTDLFGPRL